MVKIAVVDDSEADRSLITEYLKKYESEKGEKLQIFSFSDGMEFIETYDAGYGIVFLDIKMPLIDGISLARKIREKDEAVVLIFITNMAQYAIKGYEVNAMDYLLKPLKYFVFQTKLEKAIFSCQGA